MITLMVIYSLPYGSSRSVNSTSKVRLCLSYFVSILLHPSPFLTLFTNYTMII